MDTSQKETQQSLTSEDVHSLVSGQRKENPSHHAHKLQASQENQELGTNHVVGTGQALEPPFSAGNQGTPLKSKLPTASEGPAFKQGTSGPLQPQPAV
jgi:hypothetical protein